MGEDLANQGSFPCSHAPMVRMYRDAYQHSVVLVVAKLAVRAPSHQIVNASPAQAWDYVQHTLP